MSGTPSIAHCLWVLIPLVPSKEKRRFVFLLVLAVAMALTELLLTGMVALLAAIFGSPEAVLNNAAISRFRTYTGFAVGEDPRIWALIVLIGIFAAVVAKNALTVVQQWHLSTFSESVGRIARSHIFRFYQRAPFLWIMRNGVADLNFGLSAAANLAVTLTVSLQVFTSFLMVFTLLAGLLLVSPIPSLMFLGVLGIGGVLIVKGIRKFLDACAGSVYNANYFLSKVTHLALHGLKEMRLYQRENALFAAYTGQLTDAAQANRSLQTFVRLPVCCLEMLGFATLVAVMVFLIFVQDAGMARISGIMGFLAAAAWRALPVANRLVDSVTQMRTGKPFLQKTAELVLLEKSLAPELLPLKDIAPTPLPFAQSIVLEGISFAYPEASSPAVTDVSLTIPKGAMVGIVGLSGAGKSTLVNLLTGLLPPSSGSIFVDGARLSKENAGAWLQRIGYVAQAPYILDASLAENIALSRWGEEINRERILECCRMAALDFLDDLEQGLDTILGDRGTRLSGGQAQRVAIARALYGNPDLIIFDEATSALDMKNEKAIHGTILSLREQVTMVIIAHRLTTVEGCDTLIWMDKGKIRRTGSVEQVLREYEVALQLSHRENREG